MEGERATIGAGARLGAVYDALDAHGRTIPAGCGPTVGIAGLTLGGGLGILGRLHGLTSDSLRAAQVVLADGRVVDADEELLWALRGAGGARFGVVTSLVFATIPAPPTTAFELVFAPARRHRADRRLAGLGARRAGRDGREPAAQRGRRHAAGPRVRRDGRLARRRRRRGSASWRPRRAPRPRRPPCGRAPTARRSASSPGSARPTRRRRGHPLSRSEFFAERLPAPTIEALVRTLRVAPAPAELDFSPWGGAYTRVAREATAFAHRDARFLLKHAIVVDAGAPPARAASGSPARGRSRTRSGPAASTRTSPSRTSTPGTPRTTAPTASGCSRSSAGTTRTACSGLSSLTAPPTAASPPRSAGPAAAPRAYGCWSACSPSGLASTMIAAPLACSTAAGSA